VQLYQKPQNCHANRISGNLFLLFLFLVFPGMAHTPSDTLRQHLRERIEAIMDRYHFTDADKALQLLSAQGKIANQHSRPDLYLTVLLNKAWVAEHHQKIDSLYYYLVLGDDVLDRHARELEKLDSGQHLRSEFVYEKGMYHYLMGDLPSAIENFKSVIYSQGQLVIQDSLYTFDALCNIGLLYALIPDRVQAVYYYNVARGIVPKNDPTYSSARDYQYQLAFLEASMADVEFQNNNAPNLAVSAKKFHHVLRRLSGKETASGAQNLILTIYNRLGDICVRQGAYDSAVYWTNRSLRIIKGGDPEIQIKTLLAAGKVNRAALKFKKAGQCISEAINIASHLYPNHHRIKAMALYEKGILESSQQHWISALNIFQQALQQLTDNYVDMLVEKLPSDLATTNEYSLIKVVIEKANTFYAWHRALPGDQEKLRVAIAHYEYAAKSIDNMKLLLEHDESEQIFASTLHGLYEKAIAACYDACSTGMGDEYLARTFYFMEKSKASVLLRATRNLTSQQLTSMPVSIVAKENLMKGKLYYWQHQLVNANTTEVNAIQLEILKAREAFHAIIDSLKKNYPAYYTLRYDSRIATLKETMHKLIQSDNAILEYFYGERDMYILLISSSETKLKKISLTSEFRSALASLLVNIKNNPAVAGSSNLSEMLSSAAILHQHLVSPVSDKLPSHIKKLLIIPDGLLGYLPFEMLIPSVHRDTLTTSLHQLPFLVKRFAIRYEPSANIAMLKDQRANNNTAYTYLGFAPSYDLNSVAGTDPQLQGSNNNFLRHIGPLSFNETEVRGAATYFSKSGNYFGADASERSFKTYAIKSRIIHLAMHAIVNDQNSLYSGLLFSDARKNIPPKPYPGEDGFLYLYELYNMKLEADLAVLSACMTGVGEMATGEGIMSIGRGFQYAGCPAVAMSLWQVNDRSTSIIMRLFFSNLGKGMSKDEALQHAKIAFLDDPANGIFAHPFFWSAFILVGDEAPIETTQSHTKIIFLTALLFIVAWLFVLFGRKRIKNSHGRL
jgi:CHAT domain-containing protein